MARALHAGDRVSIDGESVAVANAIAVGHKLARRAIARGREGRQVRRADRHRRPRRSRAGEHVHTHNLKSDYLPTYTLEAGRVLVAKHA